VTEVRRAARIVFMGTPEFALPTLAMLLERQNVVLVYTQPDRPAGRGRRMKESPVKGLARSAGVPVEQPPSLRGDGPAAVLAAYEPDVVVVAAYGLILPPAVLAAPSHGALNVHASLLPRWRGAAPVQRAILAGDKESGVSIMLMDPGLDTGPVLARRATPVGPEETAGELGMRLAVLGAELLGETLGPWLAGGLVPQPQDDAGSTAAPKLAPAERELDWTDSATNLARRVRALAPAPGARTWTPDGPLKVLRARAVSGSLRAGAVNMESGAPRVGCGGGGMLVLETVQPAGRRAMSGADFARGRSRAIWELLPHEGFEHDHAL
jgi:methionyl-tRNA formyltransferase